jgi:hypothetical protein
MDTLDDPPPTCGKSKIPGYLRTPCLSSSFEKGSRGVASRERGLSYRPPSSVAGLYNDLYREVPLAGIFDLLKKEENPFKKGAGSFVLEGDFVCAIYEKWGIGRQGDWDILDPSIRLLKERARVVHIDFNSEMYTGESGKSERASGEKRSLDSYQMLAA